MAGVLGWGWYPTGKIWLPIVVNDAGKLEIAGVEDAEIRQDTPEDLLHVPYGYYAGGPAYLPYKVESDGKLQIAVVPFTGEGARVYNDANISIPNGAATALTFNSERYDTDSIHSLTLNTGRLTCKTAGKYIIIFTGFFASHATGRRNSQLKLNGVTFIAMSQWDTCQVDVTGIMIACIYELAVGDYVEVIVYQNSGAALNIVYQAQQSPEFMMQRIG